MILLLASLLLATPQVDGTPQRPTLESELPRRADELALQLVSSLDASGVLERHGIQAFAFPGAIGDVKGAMGAHVRSHLFLDLKMERIAQREERVRILEDSYRKGPFEDGLYDLESLKKLGGQFLDNEGILGVRVYTSEGEEGLWIHAQAELWDASRASEVWNYTAKVVVAWPAPPPPPPIPPPPPVEEPWTSKLPQALLILFALLAIAAIFRWLNRTAQIQRAAKLGGQAVERKVQKKRDRNLLAEGARRLNGAADRLAEAMSQAPLQERDAWLDSVERLRALTREVENAPAGSFRQPVENAKDPAAAALRSLGDHDERTLGLIEETERAADAVVRLPHGSPASGLLSQLNELADGVRRRLGERSDLVRSKG